ncbi:hypothetical protein E2320_004627 [Naja naja]|nr:hypothetical protein E2320_004627 [Naja naja]
MRSPLTCSNWKDPLPMLLLASQEFIALLEVPPSLATLLGCSCLAWDELDEICNLWSALHCWPARALCQWLLVEPHHFTCCCLHAAECLPAGLLGAAGSRLRAEPCVLQALALVGTSSHAGCRRWRAAQQDDRKQHCQEGEEPQPEQHSQLFGSQSVAGLASRPGKGQGTRRTWVIEAAGKQDRSVICCNN